MGASAAYHLAKRGVKDVVLLERETLGSGSTSKSAGGIRAQFADELNVRIALRSMAEFQALDRVSGIDYKRNGYLFLLTNEVDVENFRNALAVQQNLGVPSQLISPDDVKTLIPAARDLRPPGGAPTAPSTATPRRSPSSRPTRAPRPRRACRSSRARRSSASPCSGTRSSASRRPRGGSGRTRSSAPPASGRGTWATSPGSTSPCAARRAGCTSRPEDGGLPEELPLTVDFATGFYFHREGEGLVFGGREPTIEGVASHGDAPPARARRAADPVVLVGLLRDEPRPQRDRRRGRPAAAVPLRDRLLRPRLPAGAGRRRAPRRARSSGVKPTLDLSPLSLDRFERGRRAARAVRGLRRAALRPRPPRRVDAEPRAPRQRRPERAGGAHRARA